MKVLVCHPGKQHVNALLTGLDRRGALVRFFTMLAANRLPAFLPKSWRGRLKNFTYRNIDEGRLAHFPLLFLLFKMTRSEYWDVRIPYEIFDRWTARRLRREEFDIVIGYENTTLHTFRTAKKLGKTTVLDLAGVHHAFQNPVLTAVGFYQNPDEVEFISKKKDAALAVTDHVITLSKFGERTLVDAGFPAGRIHRAYLGIDHSVFVPKKEYRAEGPLQLYFVGTLSRRKGMPFAVELVENLRRRGLDLHLTFIGPLDGFDPSGLNPEVFTHIPFVGHAELVALHHSLDLFLFPSNIDSWAQTVVEAMACGSPALVSTNTGAQDAVEQGGGMVLPVGEMAAWEAAVERFYHDRALLKRVGERAADVARQYTWDGYHERIFDILSNLKPPN